MIPISDEGGRIKRFPIVTVTIIALNIVVFLYEEFGLSDRQLQQFVMQFGVVPLEITRGQDRPPLLPPGLPIEFTILSSMFMHGGWLHIIGNMLYLWVFGDNIEDAMSPLGFLVFYVVCGAAAALSHILLDPNSTVPTIGASGAVAGVLGGYLLLHPANRVNCLLILWIFIRVIQLPAFVVLGFWFIMQLFSGVGSIGAEEVGGVAYWAHVGGFVAGFILMIPIALFTGIRKRTSRRRGRFLEYDDWR